MEFEYTPEQIQLRKTVREFAEEEIASARPRVGRKSDLSARNHQKCRQAGLLGALFPEELGGAGLGYIDYSIIIEELARVDPSVGLIVAAHNSLCTNHIFRGRQRRADAAGTSRSSLPANGSAAGP